MTSKSVIFYKYLSSSIDLIKFVFGYVRENFLVARVESYSSILVCLRFHIMY